MHVIHRLLCTCIILIMWRDLLILWIMWKTEYFQKYVFCFWKFKVHYREIVYFICRNFCRVSAVHYFLIFCVIVYACVYLWCFSSCKTHVYCSYISVMTLGFLVQFSIYSDSFAHVLCNFMSPMLFFTPCVFFTCVNYRWTMP